MDIALTLPPPINKTYKTTRSGGFYKSQLAKDWENESLWTIKSHCRSIHDFKRPVYVGLLYFINRDRDIDSSIKITLDVLQKSGLLKNDMDITHLNVKKEVDKKKPRLEIEIQNL